MIPNLRLGTCSWKYDSWKGLIYDPAKTYSPHDYLSDYARHFSTVEIDEWFWSLFPTGLKLPNPETVKAYAESVPDDFQFTVKAPNSITLNDLPIHPTHQRPILLYLHDWPQKIHCQ